MHKTVTPPILPDVAFDAAAQARALDWVGMDGMALPIRVAGDGDAALLVPASVDVAVTHALFVGDALAQLRAAGVRHVWSSDAVPHASAVVPINALLASAVLAI